MGRASGSRRMRDTVVHLYHRRTAATTTTARGGTCHVFVRILIRRALVWPDLVDLRVPQLRATHSAPGSAWAPPLPAPPSWPWRSPSLQSATANADDTIRQEQIPLVRGGTAEDIQTAQDLHPHPPRRQTRRHGTEGTQTQWFPPREVRWQGRERRKALDTPSSGGLFVGQFPDRGGHGLRIGNYTRLGNDELRHLPP